MRAFILRAVGVGAALGVAVAAGRLSVRASVYRAFRLSRGLPPVVRSSWVAPR